MRRKILLVGPAPPLVGGITTVFLTLCRSSLFTTKYKSIILDSNIASYRLQKLWIFTVTLIKLCTIILTEKPDIVHVQVAQSSYFKDSIYLLISKLFGSKTVAHFHARPNLFDSLRTINKWYISISSLFIDVLAVLTPAVKCLFQKHGWKKGVVDIPNVVDTSAYPRLEKKSEETIICHLGRLSSSKGLITLVEIARILRFEPMKFLLAGPFDLQQEKKAFFEKTSDLNNIEWVGPLTGQDKVEFLAKGSFFILPTHWAGEVFPLVILEAGAARLTVLISPVGSIPEIIKDMENGVFIDMQKPHEIADQILWLHEHHDKARALANALHRDVAQKYSTSALDSKLLSIYSDLLGE